MLSTNSSGERPVTRLAAERGRIREFQRILLPRQQVFYGNEPCKPSCAH
jgi:hypothetical protein